MDVNDPAVLSDKIGGGHSLRSDFGNDFLSMVEDDRERCLEPFEKFFGIGWFLVSAYSNDNEAVLFIFLVQFFVGGKCLATGSTPRRPEVVEDNFAIGRGHFPSGSEGFRIGKG